MKTHTIMFAILVTLQGVLFDMATASDWDTTPAPVTTLVKSTGYAPGTAIAGASGLCVKDWKPGWQKCIAWTMIDVENEENVHGFGGGLTTRVDQFAVHLFAGIEDLEGDDTTILIGGSLNWR